MGAVDESSLFERMRQGRLQKIWADLSSSLGFRPALWMTGLSLLALLFVTIDSLYPTNEAVAALPLLFQSSPEGARTMLGAIATAMLTVTSLAFSILMVAVTQAANAYSPRLLREYFSDRHNQHVLGILIGTFLYSLIALRGVRVSEDSTFVPLLAINFALLLAVIATAALVSLLNHVAHSIKVSNIILLILKRTQEQIDLAFPHEAGTAWPNEEPPLVPASESAVVASRHSGYIQIYNLAELMETAVDNDIVIELLHRNGDFVIVGTPLARIWPESRANATVGRAIVEAIVLGSERTFAQDVRFGIRQLADIAIRALSPGINDPTTAIDAVNSLASSIVHIIRRGPVSPYRCDQAGEVRLRFPPLLLEPLLNEAFSQILHYGRSDGQLLARVITVCGEIGQITPNADDREALWRLILTAAELAKTEVDLPFERAALNIALQQAAIRLQQEASPYLLDAHARLEPTTVDRAR